MELNEYLKLEKMQKDHWWFLGRKKILKGILDSLDINKSKVLDIGGGMGGNVELLQNYGSVTVIDKEIIAIEKLKKINEINIITGSFPEDFINKTLEYDLVTMLDVLEHFYDDITALRFLYEKMPNGAKLVITVPAYSFLFSQHDKNCHHYRRYTLSGLRKDLENSGFELIYSSYFNSFLFPLALISRFIARLRGETFSTELEPNKIINIILFKIFKIESKFIPRVSFPFGLSIVAVCKKNVSDF